MTDDADSASVKRRKKGKGVLRSYEEEASTSQSSGLQDTNFVCAGFEADLIVSLVDTGFAVVGPMQPPALS